jgi:Xaa-Pro aminopeptidase
MTTTRVLCNMPFTLRIQQVQQKLIELGCQALLVEDTINLYYLTGMTLSLGTLLVHEKGAQLFVDGRYFELCQKQAPCEVILSTQLSFASFLSKQENAFIHTVGFDAEHTSYKQFLDWQKKLEPLSRKLQPLDHPIKALRMIKDEIEMALIRQAAQLGSKGFDFVCSLLKEGISEAEAALELEIFWKRQGAKGVAFDPIIAFGSNSSMPHYRAGNTLLKKGMPVLIDIGVNDQHYHSDMTRVVFFGEPDPEIQKIHCIVERAQQKAIDLCRPGTLMGELDKAARSYIAQQGYGDCFTHNLGHGVGLEIHEAPWVRGHPPYSLIPLQPGMVMTIEPGIYLPGLGGVRIEDTLLITDSGHENLTLRPTQTILIK